MRAGAVTHAEDVFGVEAEAFRVVQHPGKDAVGIFQLGGILELRREAVGEVHHREAVLRETHAVILVALLVAVDPGAAVDADDHGQLAARAFGAIDVQHVPAPVRAVYDVVIADDIRRGRKARVALFVPAPEDRAHEHTGDGHTDPSR